MPLPHRQGRYRQPHYAHADAGALQISTSKNDVDCIVTEYGIAKLRGLHAQPAHQGSPAIAHPKFRDMLTYEAKKENILI